MTDDRILNSNNLFEKYIYRRDSVLKARAKCIEALRLCNEEDEKITYDEEKCCYLHNRWADAESHYQDTIHDLLNIFDSKEE